MDRPTLFAAAALLAPAALSAQTARAAFIDWGNVTASVYADTAFGVQLWVGTSYRAMDQSSRGVDLDLPPDSIYPWADAAALVIAPVRPPHDGASVLTTPPLRALDGTKVWMLRRAAGREWGDRVVLSFEASDTTIPALNIAAHPREARGLLDAVYAKAGISALIPDWADRLRDKQEVSCEGGAPVTRPTVASGSLPSYPVTALSSGRVLLEFVIGANGYADRVTIRALAATDEIFVRPAIEAVVRTRFIPGSCNGTPVPVLVRQSVNYVR